MPTAQLYMTLRGLIDGAFSVAPIFGYIGLYTNPAALMKGFDPALLTEATFSGYSRFHLNSGDWTSPPYIDSDGNAHIDYPEITFTKSGAVANAEIWGFFITNDLGTLILFAQQFAAAPYPMVLDGDLLRLTPSYAVSNPIFP